MNFSFLRASLPKFSGRGATGFRNEIAPPPPRGAADFACLGHAFATLADPRRLDGGTYGELCLMSFLTVRHSTVYRYSEPVGLGEHRMMFRPRESHDLRLIRTGLAITPRPSHLRWLHDPFDNSVAVACFEGATTRELRFESTVSLEHFESTLPEYPLEDYAQEYPFRYSDDDFANLGRGLTNHYPSAKTDDWVLDFLDPSPRTGTMKILRSMTCGIREKFTYTRRTEKGIQTPDETLRTGKGSCRDFAVLMP